MPGMITINTVEMAPRLTYLQLVFNFPDNDDIYHMVTHPLTTTVFDVSHHISHASSTDKHPVHVSKQGISSAI